MSDFAYRELSDIEIVEKSDNVTSVNYDFKKITIYYKTMQSNEILKVWLDPSINTVYCNTFSSTNEMIAVGESETDIYYVTTSRSQIAFYKSNKEVYKAELLKKIDLNYNASYGKDIFIDVKYRENGFADICVKNGYLAKFNNDRYSYVIGDGYIFEEVYTIEVPLIRKQLGIIKNTFSVTSSYFTSYYIYRAYEIGGSGSTGLNIDPSKARVTFIDKDGNDITLLDTGCLIDTTGFDLSKVVELGEVQVLTDLNLVSQPVTLEIPQEVIPDWVSIGEIEEETIQ